MSTDRTRPTPRSQMAGLRVAGALALFAAVTPVGAAHAQSGDFPLTDNPEAVPTYNIPAATCATIQSAVNAEVDLILACSRAGRAESPGPGASPCDLIDGTVNAGLSVGQCLSSFPTPLLLADRTADVLEENTTINASAGGLNLAQGDQDSISVTSVASGVGRTLGVVNVQEGSCSGEGDCPASCDGVDVFASATACTAISQRLAASVVDTPPALSHALLLDVEQTGTADLLKVAVCPGYRWTCTAPGATAAGATYAGQVPFSIVYTPLTARFSRITLCSTC